MALKPGLALSGALCLETDQSLCNIQSVAQTKQSQAKAHRVLVQVDFTLTLSPPFYLSQMQTKSQMQEHILAQTRNSIRLFHVEIISFFYIEID